MKRRYQAPAEKILARNGFVSANPYEEWYRDMTRKPQMYTAAASTVKPFDANSHIWEAVSAACGAVASGGSVDIGFPDILPHASIDSHAKLHTDVSFVGHARWWIAGCAPQDSGLSPLTRIIGSDYGFDSDSERLGCVLTVPCHHTLLRLPFPPPSQGCVPGDFTSLFWREFFHSSLGALLAPPSAKGDCHRVLSLRHHGT